MLQKKKNSIFNHIFNILSWHYSKGRLCQIIHRLDMHLKRNILHTEEQLIYTRSLKDYSFNLQLPHTFSIETLSKDNQEKLLSLFSPLRLKGILKHKDYSQGFFIYERGRGCAICFMMASLQTPYSALKGLFDNHMGYISFLATHPDFRRQGCANIILQYCLQYLFQSGCLSVVGLINKNNSISRHFISKSGFIPIGHVYIKSFLGFRCKKIDIDETKKSHPIYLKDK